MLDKSVINELSDNNSLTAGFTPAPPLEIRPDDNWDALFDLPAESWDLFNLDNDHAMIFDEPSMSLPAL